MIFLQVHGAHILEGGHHLHLVTQEILRLLAGRATGRQLHCAHLGRHQGDGDIDEYLAGQPWLDGFQGGQLMLKRHGQHHQVSRAGRF